MKKIIKLSFIAFLMAFVFRAEALCEDNIGRHVYCVFTENFNGVKVDLSSWTGQTDRPEIPDVANSPDRAGVWPDKYPKNTPNASIDLAEVLYTSLAESNDGNMFWRITARINASGASVWMPVFWLNAAEDAEEDRNIADTPGGKDYTGGTLEFWIRSSSLEIEKVKVGIKAAGANRVIPLSSCGDFDKNNPDWQKISIPLGTLYSSLASVSSPFILLAEGPNFSVFPVNLTIDIDSVVLKKPGTGTWSANLKNISDNSGAAYIEWDESALGKRWVASKQYLELDLDTMPDGSWGIQIYTSNTDGFASPRYTGALSTEMASGLVSSSDTAKMLPMCWRVTDKVLPYSGANTGDDYDKTLKIGFNAGGLFDQGGLEAGDSNADTYYCWFAMKDSGMFSLGNPDIANGADYLKVWDKRGFHAAAGEENYWGMSPGKMYGFMIKPRIYLGADFGQAMTPMTYQTNSIVIELFHE